uniref:Uncharacterized protein n=1 Tax=Strigamia maritima TaxID=126957 RepID=T1JGV3_STRMM
MNTSSHFHNQIIVTLLKPFILLHYKTNFNSTIMFPKKKNHLTQKQLLNLTATQNEAHFYYYILAGFDQPLQFGIKL